MGDFRWLHFSDLHLDPGHSDFNTKMAWEALLECLDKEDFGNRSDLYVFITGDIFNKGRFEQGNEKIAQIKDFLEVLKVRKERVFWAPGNHDMKRRTGGELIANLRLKKYTLDKLKDDKEEDENGNTRFQLLTRQRMHFYAKYNQLFFDRKLTKSDLDKIHQTYLLDDFNLIVLNTSFTSFDDNDARQIFLCSSELHDAFSHLDKEKPVLVMGHHGKDFWEPNDKRLIESLFEKNVDVYLCGHEHEPGIERIIDSGREIQQFTCGGGVFDGYSIFNFFYGMYDSSDSAVEIIPYVYQRTNVWERCFTGIKRNFKEGTKYYFTRLIGEKASRACDTGNGEEEESNEKYRGFATWDINRLAWRIRYDWDPDVGGEIPLDDKYAVALPTQLIADRGKYALFLAGGKTKGLLNALACEEDRYFNKFQSKREKWERRIWIEYKDYKPENEIAEDMVGLLVSQNAESLTLQEMKKALLKWNDMNGRIALLFHIWSDNPFNAVICAQRASHLLREVFSVPVLFTAEIDASNEDGIAGTEIDYKISTYNQEGLTREEEVKDMLKYRDSYPDRWALFLKKHATKRKGNGWICGYEASYRTHEYAQIWIAAIDLNLFFCSSGLSPFLLRLSREKIENLTWELFLLNMHSPTATRKELLHKLRGQVSESMRILMKAWGHREFSSQLMRLDYEEIAKWARQADKGDFIYAFYALENDEIKRWVLMMSSIYAIDYIMEMLTDSMQKREAKLVLNQASEYAEDVVLEDKTNYIRYLVHNDNYRENIV